jgi:geranylgeranyl reductase family protein
MADGKKIVVVGGGPAGAMAGERLARGGRAVVVIDEKLAWEKPCGGGVTPKTLLRYPYLAEAAVARNWVDRCELISPAGRRVSFGLEQKIAVFSRRVLNGLMLDRAQEAGSEILQDRILAIEGSAGQWRLRTRSGQTIVAESIIIANGARSPFRGLFAPPFRATELMISAGYYVPGGSNRMQIRFIEGLDGYIWTFPRTDHFSAGIAAKMSPRGHTSAELRRMLEEFLEQEGFAYRGAPFFSHIIPSPALEALNRDAFCGEGWAIVGDAAGLVDPITGEGIYYALRSAELAADALLDGRPQAYRTMLAQELLPELAVAIRYADRFYRGTFLGQPVLERMVQFVAESIHVRKLIADLFTGAQAYVTLRGRCYRQLLPALWQSVSS